MFCAARSLFLSPHPPLTPHTDNVTASFANLRFDELYRAVGRARPHETDT